MWIFSRLVFVFYRLISWTWRIRIYEDPEFTKLFSAHQPVTIAHWHGDELALLHLSKKYRIATMVSASKDGSVMNYVLQSLGATTSRGSSSRGAISALKGLIRLGKTGHFLMSVAVDGPRGPIYVPKIGIFEISKLCNAPITSFGVACNSKKIFRRAWNKIYLPLPFAKVSIVFSRPIPALSKTDDPRDPAWITLLAQQLDVAQRQAGKFIADTAAEC